MDLDPGPPRIQAVSIDKLLESNLLIKDEDEDDGDEDDGMRILENLIFSDHERSYNRLDPKTAAKVIQALNETENGLKDPVYFQCEHCEEIFIFEDFQMHVCNYDENHQLITIAPHSETEIQALHRYAMEILQENQLVLKELIKEKFPKPAECMICCRKFVHEAGLYRHWDKHIGEILKPSPPEDPEVMKCCPLCSACGEVFYDENEAWKHVQSKHITLNNQDLHLNVPEGFVVGVEVEDSADESSQDNKKSKLDLNNNVEPSKDQATLQTHTSKGFIKMILMSKVFQCEFCDAVFENVQLMLHHVSKHSASSGFQCECCELKDLTFKQILLHRRDECVIFKDYRNGLKDFPRVWVCNVCDGEFQSTEQLFEHRYDLNHYFPRVDHRTNELAFSCEQCLVIFPTAASLIDHFNEKHSKKPKPDVMLETSERISKPSSSTSTRRGGSHQTSTRPRQYLCEVCGKSYTQSSHLWQHLRFHQGVKPFACSVDGCDRRFTIRPDLNDHVRKCHTGERPFLCTLCGKRFLTGSVYYQHRLIHRGERRYGCEECGKRFYRADALKNHLRIHTGEKPHLCSVCGKSFRQRGDRDKHIKARHPQATIIPSPKRQRVKSFGRGRVKNNTSLYESMPGEALSMT